MLSNIGLPIAQATTDHQASSSVWRVEDQDAVSSTVGPRLQGHGVERLGREVDAKRPGLDGDFFIDALVADHLVRPHGLRSTRRSSVGRPGT